MMCKCFACREGMRHGHTTGFARVYEASGKEIPGWDMPAVPRPMAPPTRRTGRHVGSFGEWG